MARQFAGTVDHAGSDGSRRKNRNMKTPKSASAGALGTAGFTFLELLVALSLFAAVSVFILQAFIAGMSHAGRANERAAATTVAMQMMEQIRASVNPYTMVGFTDLPRTPVSNLGGTAYAGVINPTPHTFDVAVDVASDNDLTLTTATVNVYRPSDPDASPFASLTTVLDDH
jgi:prepilin-type N-terminal cleavage/methylation domain-containing protein